MNPRRLQRAEKLYRDFHQLEPRAIGTFGKGFQIPRQARFAGGAEHVLYRSDKLNPTTGQDEGVIDYIHEHEGGVVLCHSLNKDGQLVRVPKWIWSQQALTKLGDCLGFAYRDEEDDLVEVVGTRPLPELYAIPSGKALIVIQGKRTVVALMWGGKLGVEPRGIVG